MFEEKTLNIWSNIYFASLIIAAIAGAISIAAGFIQNRLSSSILDKMKSSVAIANEDAAKANETAAKANLRAAEVEKQNIELRLKVANRRITEEQHRILVKELSNHRATFNMEVMGDPESGLFAADILKTFEDAGWKVDKKEFPLGVIWHGLILFQTKDPSGLIIAESLKKANIPFSIGDQWRDRVTIMIGGKPPVF